MSDPIIKINNMNKWFGDFQVLKDINLDVEKNKKIVVCGPSGSGKSTLLDLLPVFIKAHEGNILIDGVNINKYSIRSLRKRIAFIPQDPLLFSGTIRENITYFNKSASFKEIKEAMITSGSFKFVNELPQGLETILYERGQNLSGGQKQRIVLARAFLTNAPILILDEATSALDVISEIRIKKTIQHLRKKKNVTVIIITHRMSSIKNADYIASLVNKKIVNFGPPKKILKKI